MYPCDCNAVLSHGSLRFLQKRRPDASVLHGCLDIEPMQKRFVCVFYAVVPDAPDHAVVFIDGNPEPVPLVKVALLNLEQIVVDMR